MPVARDRPVDAGRKPRHAGNREQPGEGAPAGQEPQECRRGCRAREHDVVRTDKVHGLFEFLARDRRERRESVLRLERYEPEPAAAIPPV